MEKNRSAKDFVDTKQKPLKRRLATESRLTQQLKSGERIPDDKKKEYVESQLKIVSDRIKGIKKPVKKVKTTTGNSSKNDDYVIDIFTISHSRIKRSERRKNKGKSRKGLKTVRTLSLLRTVAFRDGVITAYKDGKMGLSPRNHAFKVRKVEKYL